MKLTPEKAETGAFTRAVGRVLRQAEKAARKAAVAHHTPLYIWWGERRNRRGSRWTGGDAMQREYAALIEEFIRLLVGEFGDRVASVLVFGSVARGTARANSDIDLCVIIRDLPASRYQRHQLLAQVLAALLSGRTYCDAIQPG